MIAAVLLCLLPALPQAPREILARFQLDGKPAVVTRTDVAVEMAFRQRRQDLGRQACEVLVDAALVRQAATAKQLLPNEAEVRSYWQSLQAELRAAGQRPEEIAAVRNTDEAELLEFLSLQLAQERLVRAELRLQADAKVSGDLQRLWVQEQRQRSKIITDPDELPAATAAMVDGKPIAMIDLGLMLLRTADDSERQRFIQQVVYLQCLEAAGRKHGVEAGPADLATALANMAKEAQGDPRYRGLSFERLLETQGLTPTSLLQSRVFRAKVLLAKLGERLFSAAEFAAARERDAQALLDTAGPRRRLAMIFLRATKEPNALIPLDHAAANAQLLKLRERLATEQFEVLARIHSQEPQSKAQGGDLGWHHRRSQGLPEPLLAAAFALAEGELSQPIATDDGCFLLKLTAVEPMPTTAEWERRWREQQTQAFAAELLENARLAYEPAPGQQPPR
jgi:parvulin-like peptidyl-prolyl isomerase